MTQNRIKVGEKILIAILISIGFCAAPFFSIKAATTIGSNISTTGTLTVPIITSTGALSITSGGTNALILDTGGAAALNIGNTNASSISLGRSGIATTINGSLTVPNYADFTSTSNPAYSEGRLFYDKTLKSLSYYNDQSAVPVDIGQKNILRVKNQSGVPISYGEVVYITGATVAGVPTVALAQANALGTSKVLGLAGQNIADGAEGYVTAYGLLTNLNTAIYTAGDPVYLSPTAAGGITATRPVYPNYDVPVGYIGKSGVADGTILAFVVPKPSTKLNSGEISFGDVTGDLVGDGANLFWDNAAKRLGIGDNTPSYALDVAGDIKAGDGYLLMLGTKSDPDPAGTNGAMYYNTSTNKFRCFENSGWKDCDSSAGAASLQSAYDNGATITTAGATDIALVLAAGDFSISGAGAVNLSPASGVNLTPWGVGAGNATELRFAELAANGSNYVGFKSADNIGADLIWTLPAADGAAGEVLITDGAGGLSWTSAGGGTALSAITAATGVNTINNGDNAQTWNWNLTNNNKSGFTFGENTASTGTETSIVNVSNLASSTAVPLVVNNRGDGNSFRVDDESGDSTPFIINKDGNVMIGTESLNPIYPEKLKVDSATTGNPTVISGSGDLNLVVNMNIQNRNAGTGALSVIGALADNGSSMSNNVSMGMASSGFSSPIIYPLIGANDAFVVSSGNDMIVGNATAGYSLKFITGNGFQNDAERMTIDSTGNVGIATITPGSKLDVKGVLRLSGSNSGYVGLAPAADAGAITYTLPSSDGAAGQVLSTDGSAALSWVSPAGVWQRAGTTLSPVIASDDVTTSGNIYTSGLGTITSGGLLTASNGLTLTTGALNLTATSGAFSLSGLTSSSISTTGANNLVGASVNINTTGTGAVSIGNGTGAVSLTLGSDAQGDVYYRNAAGGLSRLAPGTSGQLLQTQGAGADPQWATVTATESDTLQTVYGRGNSISTTGSDISFTLNGADQFAASGAGSVNLNPTGASGFTSGGALTLTGGAASTWGTAAGDLILQAAGGVSANVQIGAAGTSATPNYLVLDNGSAEPAGSNGAMYYSTSLNAFRCYENGGWQNCGSSVASATTLQQSYVAGNTISTDLINGNFDVTGTEAVNLTPAAASQFTAGGALTLTGGGSSTWSVTGAGNDLSIDAADVLNLGTTNAASVIIGQAGITTTSLGTLQSGDAAAAGSFKIADGSSNYITLTSPAIGADYTLILPVDDGTPNQFLSTNGNGVLSWTNPVNPMTTEGDIAYYTAGAVARLPIGASGTVLKSDGVDPAWAVISSSDVGLGNVTNDAQIPKSIGDAKGDLIIYTANDTPVKLPVGGTNGWVLAVDSTQATGIKWAPNLPTDDSIDFAQLKDAMAVDANTSINLAGSSLTINDLVGGGALSITTNGAALTLTGGAASTWSTTAGNLTLQAGSGTVSLGNSTNLTASGALAITSGAATALTLNSGTTGALLIGTDASAETINIGTGAAVKTLTGSSAKVVKNSLFIKT